MLSTRGLDDYSTRSKTKFTARSVVIVGEDTKAGGAAPPWKDRDAFCEYMRSQKKKPKGCVAQQAAMKEEKPESEPGRNVHVVHAELESNTVALLSPHLARVVHPRGAPTAATPQTIGTVLASPTETQTLLEMARRPKAAARLKLLGARTHHPEPDSPYGIASTRSPLWISVDERGKLAPASKPLIDETVEQILIRGECKNVDVIRTPPLQLKPLQTRRWSEPMRNVVTPRSCAAIVCKPLGSPREWRPFAEHIVWVEHLTPTELGLEFGSQLAQAWQQHSRHARQFHERGQKLGDQTHDVYAQRDGKTSAPA